MRYLRMCVILLEVVWAQQNERIGKVRVWKKKSKMKKTSDKLQKLGLMQLSYTNTMCAVCNRSIIDCKMYAQYQYVESHKMHDGWNNNNNSHSSSTSTSGSSKQIKE